MYSKKDILKSLNEYNYFIDEQVLGNLIKNWKIDPVYEDEDGVEYFDSLSIVKIKKGIKLKSEGFDNDQILYHMNRIIEEAKSKEEEKVEEVVETELEQIEAPVANQIPATASQSTGLNNFTIDITSQTLQLLADAVANKITNSIKTEIKNQIENSDVIQELFPYAKKNPDEELKNDNKELSHKVEELLEDNKKMAKRIEELEKNKFSLSNFLKKYIK